MAARLVSAFQRTWHKGDCIDRYFLIGSVLGCVVGGAVGVDSVLKKRRPHDAAMDAVSFGLGTFVFWPAVALWGVAYVPLKALSMVKRT